MYLRGLSLILCFLAAPLISIGAYSYSTSYSQPADTRFKIAPIPVEPGRWPTLAIALNSHGTIIIQRQNRSYLMKNDQLIEIATLNDLNCSAYALNDREDVVGTLQTPGDYRGGTAFLWRKGKMAQLTAPGAGATRGFAINNKGTIVGSLRTASGENHACLWDGGRVTDLGTLGGKESYATDINERGQVVGSSTTAAGVQRGFLWEDGRMRDLGTLPGHLHSRATRINESGQITGNTDSFTAYDVPPVKERRTLLWQNGRITDLGTLKGGDSHPLGMNDSGEIVGMATPRGEPQQGFIYTGGKIRALDDLLMASPEWSIYFAGAINNSGVVLASAIRKSDRQRPQVILTPVLP